MPSPDRGEVWLADLGIAAKVRPCLVLKNHGCGQQVSSTHSGPACR